MPISDENAPAMPNMTSVHEDNQSDGADVFQPEAARTRRKPARFFVYQSSMVPPPRWSTRRENRRSSRYDLTVPGAHKFLKTWPPS